MYLPTEIIKELGHYLTLSEQGSCIRVCYAWYGPFLDLLYTKVHITTRNQFRLFYRTIQDSSELSDSLGSHVKELTFAYDAGTTRGMTIKERHPVGLTRDELETFPTLFKQLEVLDFNPKLWKYMRFTDEFKSMKHIKRLPSFNRQTIFQPIMDNLASQLTYLSITDNATEYILNKNLTTSIWSRVPKLEHLIIRGAQLPHLKHLTLGCVTLPLSEQDMSSTTTFPLFTSALSLTLDDVHLKNWRMITFLSLAFYHVEVLDFDITFDWFYKEDVTIELYEQSMDACMGFAQLCIFLKKIRFRRINTSVFPFPYDAFFQEVADIHQNNVHVEMTDCAWWSTIDPASSFKAVTVQTGLLSKANLKWSWTGKKTDISLFKSLKFCTHLTELTLECDVPLKNGFRLDLLLENCQQLEELHVSQALITITNRDKNIRKSRLQLLELKEVILGDLLMDYVAKSCPLLDKLWLSDCVQEKPRRSAFIVIRMPEHRFKSIKLNSLHLNPGGNNGKCETSMALLSFYESTRYESQDGRRKKKKEEMGDAMRPVAAAEMWRFYHVHKSDISKKERCSKQLRRLTTEEAAMIANYESSDKKWKSIKNALPRKSFQERNQWVKDIQFGAALLLCKSVENLEFNELTV
ncbi:unnamed protein product [Mucor hiemalis]